MYQRGETLCAYPQAFFLVAYWQQVAILSSGLAFETLDRYILLRILGGCLFRIERHSLALLDRYGAFRTYPAAEPHAVTKFLGYNFCLAVDDPDRALCAWGNAFSASGTFFRINHNYHAFNHGNSPISSNDSFCSAYITTLLSKPCND